VSGPEEFFAGYLEAALWASSDTDPETGEDTPLDGYPLDEDTKIRLLCDAAVFFHANQADLEEAANTPGYSTAHAGHDFWLTRNGHGAGFWDGDLEGELGGRLSEAARKAGPCGLYLGDDGIVYKH
jgi:hypothetical protein